MSISILYFSIGLIKRNSRRGPVRHEPTPEATFLYTVYKSSKLYRPIQLQVPKVTFTCARSKCGSVEHGNNSSKGAKPLSVKNEQNVQLSRQE